LIDNKIDDFVARIFKIYIKARKIKSNYNSSFGPEGLDNTSENLKNKGSFKSNTPTNFLKVEISTGTVAK
jgi:hypothetical protein